MASLHESMAALRIGGDDLDPGEITMLLGCEPSAMAKKGDPVGKGRTIAKTGSWQLDADRRCPADIDAQVREILGRLDLGQWDSIVDRYDVDIFCGLFMSETDEGYSMAADVLNTLGERKIRLEVCLYAPSHSDDS